MEKKAHTETRTDMTVQLRMQEARTAEWARAAAACSEGVEALRRAADEYEQARTEWDAREPGVVTVYRDRIRREVITVDTCREAVGQVVAHLQGVPR